MGQIEQQREYLRQFLAARKIAPWLIQGNQEAQKVASQAIQAMNGMAGSWRTDYSPCAYYYPQKIDGQMVSLSTLHSVCKFHDARAES